MSEVKVNKISPRSGTDVTLGDSGDTFTIPSGATINNQGTAVNFGATGSASWVTTVKTGDFTAVAGEGYFVNTTGGEIDVTLPAGTAGAVVAVKDYAKTFDTNNCILKANGSEKIGGSTVDATLSIEGLAVTLVYIDSTQGWLVTDSGLQDEAPTTKYVTATGGTITTCGHFKIHSFTGPATFCVSCAGNAAGSNTIEYLIVAGGGGGGSGNSHGAGAGAGGYRVSPSLPVSIQGYPIVVGGGGAGGPGSPKYGADGSLSSGFSISSAGGGGAGGWQCGGGRNGGSGSGSASNPQPANYGVGNTPSVNPSQGNPGGPSSGSRMGGGGGASEAGNTDGQGHGGDGTSNSITGSATFYAGGGSAGGSSCGGATIPGGEGGGGAGAGTPLPAGGAGTANTGGGGGGSCGQNEVGGAGGSGIVIIKYKFQN
jgi:hypothetical protein